MGWKSKQVMEVEDEKMQKVEEEKKASEGRGKRREMEEREVDFSSLCFQTTFPLINSVFFLKNKVTGKKIYILN